MCKRTQALIFWKFVSVQFCVCYLANACGKCTEGATEDTWLVVKGVRPIGQTLPQAEGPAQS